MGRRSVFASPPSPGAQGVLLFLHRSLGLSCGRRLHPTIDLKEGGGCVHPVENGKGHGQVHQNDPGLEAKDDFLQSVVILRAAAKGGRDPKL